MENDLEVELPTEIIQHIQSSMCMIQSSESESAGEKEAARTSLVSKSWSRAWSTHPDLVFCRYNFPSRADRFWEFAKTTLKRYEDLNLNIRSLRLEMSTNDGDEYSLAKELIVRAIKLGVVDLTIQKVNSTNRFFLPDEVLQSQTLARLNLSGSSATLGVSFNINLSLDGMREKEEEVTCYNLKSLKLKDVIVYGDICRDLIWRCPFIEELILDDVYDTNRKVDGYHEFPKLEFPKLKYMSLKFFYVFPCHDLWFRFASSLKELEIEIVYYRDEQDLRIRIPSLERLSIIVPYYKPIMNVEFDFPNIKKFEWGGALPRRLELKTTSVICRDEWESKIDIIYNYKSLSAEWFAKLSQFVRMLSLSGSRVSISIDTVVDNWDGFTYYPIYVGDGLPIAAAEKLKLIGSQAVTPAFLDAVFWSCRPKFVEIQNRCLIGLKKMNVEEFQQLYSLPWETFYQVSSDEDGYDVCFQLN